MVCKEGFIVDGGIGGKHKLHAVSCLLEAQGLHVAGMHFPAVIGYVKSAYLIIW